MQSIPVLLPRYQQRGAAAELAANTFYYLTYEGTVDLDDIDDPLQRKVGTSDVRLAKGYRREPHLISTLMALTTPWRARV